MEHEGALRALENQLVGFLPKGQSLQLEGLSAKEVREAWHEATAITEAFVRMGVQGGSISDQQAMLDILLARATTEPVRSLFPFLGDSLRAAVGQEAVFATMRSNIEALRESAGSERAKRVNAADLYMTAIKHTRTYEEETGLCLTDCIKEPSLWYENEQAARNALLEKIIESTSAAAAATHCDFREYRYPAGLRNELLLMVIPDYAVAMRELLWIVVIAARDERRECDDQRRAEMLGWALEGARDLAQDNEVMSALVSHAAARTVADACENLLRRTADTSIMKPVRAIAEAFAPTDPFGYVRGMTSMQLRVESLLRWEMGEGPSGYPAAWFEVTDFVSPADAVIDLAVALQTHSLSSESKIDGLVIRNLPSASDRQRYVSIQDHHAQSLSTILGQSWLEGRAIGTSVSSRLKAGRLEDVAALLNSLDHRTFQELRVASQRDFDVLKQRITVAHPDASAED